MKKKPYTKNIIQSTFLQKQYCQNQQILTSLSNFAWSNSHKLLLSLINYFSVNCFQLQFVKNRNLTWQNLKGLVELANLTVHATAPNFQPCTLENQLVQSRRSIYRTAQEKKQNQCSPGFNNVLNHTQNTQLYKNVCIQSKGTIFCLPQ